MGFADLYVAKNKISASIKQNPDPQLGLIMVIPSFNEPDLIRSLESLRNAQRPKTKTEIIIVINAPENAPAEIKEAVFEQKIQAESWIEHHQDENLKFHIIYKPDLPQKHAGVGLARKTGMDEAVLRFNQIDNPGGVIVNFDADAVCDDNYLVAVENHFKNHPGTTGVSIYFEHPITGNDFDNKMYRSIWLYELHLRYYKQALQYTGFPYYYHTVGSAFAVNAEVYCKQGGMNRHKAGEDFYFLQKIFPLGEFYELNTTRIIPSPRVSNRVPFGTGAAMTQLAEMDWPQYYTYSFDAFIHLKSFIVLIDKLFKINESEIVKLVNRLPESLQTFLKENDFESALKRANENSSSLKTFRKQFYQWFSAFRIIRFLNISHESYYKKGKIENEAARLLQSIGIPIKNADLLQILRKLDRGVD